MALTDTVKDAISALPDDRLRELEAQYESQAHRNDVSPRDVEARHQILSLIRKQLKLVEERKDHG